MQNIIFDLDGTLYDYGRTHQYAIEALFETAAKTLGVPRLCFEEAFHRGKKQTKTWLTEGAAQHSRLLYLLHALEYLKISPILYGPALEKVYWDSFLSAMHPFPGIEHIFQKLKAQGRRIAICTDLTTEIQCRKLQKLGLASYVDVLVTSEEAGLEKPEPKIFQIVLRKFGMCDGVLMVGDSWEKDIMGAKRAGIGAAWYHAGGYCEIEARVWRFSSFTDGSLEKICSY